MSLDGKCVPEIVSIHQLTHSCSMEELKRLDDDTTYMAVCPKPLANTNGLLHSPDGWFLHMPQTSEMSTLPVTVEILRHCNLHEQMRIAATHSINRATVKKYIDHRLELLGSRFFDDGNTLLEILRMCDAVISGDIALQIFLPETRAAWYPADLHVYVPTGYHNYMHRLLRGQGYDMFEEHLHKNCPQSHSTVGRTAMYNKDKRIIKLTVSTTAAPFSPIFELENTAVMNLISYDRFYCAYPTLTFRGLAMINNGPLYTGAFSMRTMQALLKYRARGFVYIGCHNNSGISAPCVCISRLITDTTGIWWNRSGTVECDASPREIFQRFGVLNCHWTLGGPVCGCREALALPEVRVVEDESCVLLTYP